MNINIIPYEKKYDDAILKMEKGIIQGKHIQLEIIKNNFLDRATVFQKYHALLAIGPDDKPVATCIGAQTKMGVNGINYDVGYGFETKVSPAMRNKGVGKRMASSLYRTFFHPEGLTKAFTTLKKSNSPIIRVLKKAIPGLWFYEFVYLTIPCKERLSQAGGHAGKPQLLTIQLFDENRTDSALYCHTKNGLGYFNTFKMYQLRIEQLNWLWKFAFWANKKIHLQKHAMLPAIGDTVKFATLFNHTPENIPGLNEVLEDLSTNGVHFLMVCCRRNDTVFNTLKQISINSYSYYLVTDFRVSEKDAVTLDVRCL